MNEIQLVIISAGMLAVVMNIFESVYPSEKYAKQMRMIFALIFVLTLSKPLISSIEKISDTTESVDVINENISTSTDKTLEYFKGSVERNISSRLYDILAENNIEVKEIKTSINISESGSISINEVKIAAENATQGAEAVDIVKQETGEDTLVKIEEFIE
ncbi:MAG: hypothetical protein ACI4JK_08130 [Oscillospiraceae bacterium]